MSAEGRPNVQYGWNMSEKITDRQKNYTLFVLVLVFTSSHVDRQIMGILGQPIKESLQISDTQLGLLTGIMFAVFYATLGMPMAMWADRRNRRNLISFSVFLWSGMTALCGAESIMFYIFVSGFYFFSLKNYM